LTARYLLMTVSIIIKIKSGPILSELSRTSDPSFYLKVDLNIKKITSRTLTGDLTDRLQKLLKAVESVQASNVESERAFSIVTKIRN
jgi:hypothetical protein